MNKYKVDFEGFAYVEADNEKAVFECMKNADDFHRKRIATDLVAKYCELNDINWGSLRIFDLIDYGKHYEINAVVRIKA